MQEPDEFPADLSEIGSRSQLRTLLAFALLALAFALLTLALVVRRTRRQAPSR